MMTGGAGRALVIAEPLVSGGSAARPHVAQPHAGPPASPPIDADLLFDCSLDKPSGAELIQQLRAQRERGAGATAATSSASFSPSPLGLAPPGRLALPRSQPMAIQHTRNESYGSLAAQGKCNVKPLGDFALGSTPRVWETEDEPPVRARAACAAAARPCPPRQRVTTLSDPARPCIRLPAVSAPRTSENAGAARPRAARHGLHRARERQRGWFAAGGRFLAALR